MNTLVSKPWVLARIFEPDVTIVDCRFILGQPTAGRDAYEESHIPGAIYLDLEADLSDPAAEHGGRHPLPDVERLAALLGKLGMNNDTRIIAYDDQGGSNASRLWWLLTYIGHENVYVMDEGFSAWTGAKYPVSKDQAIRVPSTYTAKVKTEWVVGVETIRDVISGADDSSNVVLIDSREPRRYAGLEEPIDKKTGHIPSALNKFWKGVHDEHGRWKSAAKLQEHFADMPKDRELIVYCGSGVTACPNILALREAGYDNVKLYAGSWSDWISYSENPVATGKE
ncbi:sulfurtransferase [Paenibacillus pini]|uniref:Thiosulfate sulfurtransferase, rhodanese n=1 Tax=Paenibacillus pini JCM 16418 TaxID=1236976 RepID=W7YGW6_9BACL|nr:sulfurtransferase [Paenibacillus pini]GAF07712.1 thiosulfate sulfurtransferase, rhodanese [Paenibacillus pini JCM 16418]